MDAPSPPGFRDYDTMARLALAGTLASVLAFLLPWVTVRLNLQVVTFSGTGLAVAPAILQSIGTPGSLVEGLAVALLAGLALVCALAGLALALAPGLRGGALHTVAGRNLAWVGLVASALVVGLMAAWVGPRVGVTVLEGGAVLGLVGFLLAAAAWPRARLLGQSGHEPAAPNPAA